MLHSLSLSGVFPYFRSPPSLAASTWRPTIWTCFHHEVALKATRGICGVKRRMCLPVPALEALSVKDRRESSQWRERLVRNAAEHVLCKEASEADIQRGRTLRGSLVIQKYIGNWWSFVWILWKSQSGLFKTPTNKKYIIYKFRVMRIYGWGRISWNVIKKLYSQTQKQKCWLILKINRTQATFRKSLSVFWKWFWMKNHY